MSEFGKLCGPLHDDRASAQHAMANHACLPIMQLYSSLHQKQLKLRLDEPNGFHQAIRAFALGVLVSQHAPRQSVPTAYRGV